jgi:pSer/pThr/pTyr-binding forkhead associated (FHA) protein
MKVRLVPLNSCDKNGKAVLCRLPVGVGRRSDADVCLSDRWVSHRHCEVYEINGTVVVRDLGSRHGTFVNDLNVPESHITPGDRLTVGLTRFRVDYRHNPMIQHRPVRGQSALARC